jgi:uncharacterized membrane protein required for colicin V production
MSFTVFDVIIFTIISISSINGLYKGSVKVTLGFAGFFISILLAAYIEPFVKELLSEYISQGILLLLVDATTSYIFSLLVIGFINNMLYKLFDPISGGVVVDSILGVITGFIRGSIISLIVFIITAVVASGGYVKAKSLLDIVQGTTRDKYPQWLQNSLSLDILDSLSHRIISLVSKDTLQSMILFEEPKADETGEALNKIMKQRKSSSQSQTAPNDELDQQLNNILPENK